jgi:hypothetical protein
VARAVAMQALDAVRAAVAASDGARRMLRKELRLLTRRPRKLSPAASVGESPSRPPAPIARPLRRRRGGLRRLVRWRAATLGQQ